MFAAYEIHDMITMEIMFALLSGCIFDMELTMEKRGTTKNWIQ